MFGIAYLWAGAYHPDLGVGGFIDIYSALDDNQMHEYQARYPQENSKMVGLTERLLKQGRLEGRQEGKLEGRQEGELNILQRQLSRRFGPLDPTTEQRLQQASSDDLERWADNILDARTLDEVFSKH